MKMTGGDITHEFWLELWNLVACAFDENVSPVSLLVHNTGEDTVTIKPRRGWPLTEALDASECRILRAT